MRRRSLEAVRCLARKTQKIQRLQFEYHYQLSGSGSYNTQPSSTISCWTTRLPRRRSLSLWSTQGNSRKSTLSAGSQSLYFFQERNALLAQSRTWRTLERGHVAMADRVKSTIVEEKTSQLERPDNLPFEIQNRTLDFGGPYIESHDQELIDEDRISAVPCSAER